MKRERFVVDLPTSKVVKRSLCPGDTVFFAGADVELIASVTGMNAQCGCRSCVNRTELRSLGTDSRVSCTKLNVVDLRRWQDARVAWPR